MQSTKLTTAQKDSALAAIPKMVDSLATKGDAWWQFLLTHDFGADQRRVKTPAVLIVTGANDQQADSHQVAEMAMNFAEAGNRDVTGVVIPGLDHLFIRDADGFPGGLHEASERRTWRRWPSERLSTGSSSGSGRAERCDPYLSPRLRSWPACRSRQAALHNRARRLRASCNRHHPLPARRSLAWSLRRGRTNDGSSTNMCRQACATGTCRVSVIAIVDGDSVVFQKAYGVRDVTENSASLLSDIHTRFAIGSTTKAMTVMALGMLVDEGKLAWDDPCDRSPTGLPAV